MSANVAVLTIAEAAELCQVSIDTIKRDLKAGRYPGAHRIQGPNSPWTIPLADLVTAGRHTPEPDVDPMQLVAQRREDRDLALLRQRLDTLEQHAAELTRQRDQATARADRLESALLDHISRAA